MKRLKAFIYETFVVMVVLSLVLIAGLVDIRNEQSPNKEKNIKAMSVMVEDNKKDIDNDSQKIEEEGKELDQAKKKMESLKDSGKIDEWNSSVIDYNTKLSKYKKDMDDYTAELKSYNDKLNEANLEAQKKESVVGWIKSILGI